MAVIDRDVPHSRDDPPWSDCGDLRDPEFGCVFAWPRESAVLHNTAAQPSRTSPARIGLEDR